MFRRWLVNSGRKTLKNLKLILIRKKYSGNFYKKQWTLLFSQFNRKKSTNPTMRRSIQRVSYAFKKMGLELVLGQHIDISWLHKSGGVEPQMSASNCQPREFNKKESQFPIATATSLNKDKKPSFEIYYQQEVRQNKPILSRVVAQGKGTTENWNLKPIMIGSDRAWFKLSCQVGVAPWRRQQVPLGWCQDQQQAPRACNETVLVSYFRSFFQANRDHLRMICKERR